MMRTHAHIARSQREKLTTIAKSMVVQIVQTANRKEREMKKSIKVSAIVLTLGLGLTACGSNSASTEIVPDAVDQQNSRDVARAEAGYLSDVRGVDNDILAYGSDADLLNMGYNACNALDDGTSLNALLARTAGTMDTEEGRQAAFAVIAGALIYFCPEYKDLVQG